MKKIAQFFSEFFGSKKKEEAPRPLVARVLFKTIEDPLLRNIVTEGFRSNAIDYEIRDGKNIYVREDELETAHAIAAQGNWL